MLNESAMDTISVSEEDDEDEEDAAPERVTRRVVRGTLPSLEETSIADDEDEVEDEDEEEALAG